MWIYLFNSNIFILMVIFLPMIESDDRFTLGKNIDTTPDEFDQCQGFDCGTPLKQRFSLPDIVDKRLNEGEVIFKEITLFRCRPSFGCCGVYNETCLANATTEHCIKFFYHYNNDDLYTERYIKIKNHVSCLCQDTVPTNEDLEEPKYLMLEKCDVE